MRNTRDRARGDRALSGNAGFLPLTAGASIGDGHSPSAPFTNRDAFRLEQHGAIVVYRRMKRRPYRFILPLLLGCISGMLMVWDVHNSRLIDSIFAADIGPPFWPYEAAWTAYLTINAPAFLLSQPVFFLLDLQTAPARYPVLFPVTLIWWWWVGRRIDRGFLPAQSRRRRWWAGVTLLVVALGLYCVGAVMIVEDAYWWSHWGVQGFGLRLLRTAGPIVWCLAVAVALTVSAFRVTSGQQSAH